MRESENSHVDKRGQGRFKKEENQCHRTQNCTAMDYGNHSPSANCASFFILLLLLPSANGKNKELIRVFKILKPLNKIIELTFFNFKNNSFS